MNIAINNEAGRNDVVWLNMLLQAHWKTTDMGMLRCKCNQIVDQ